MCKGDGDEKCFASSNDKHCDHSVTTIKLDEVGDYLVFPSRFYHHGYYKIASNKTYYRLVWATLKTIASSAILDL
jgi:hypothetical protein